MRPDEPKTIYEDYDFIDRDDYLDWVAETYGLPLESVKMIAGLLGQDEDFDGLLAMCADEAGTSIMTP